MSDNFGDLQSLASSITAVTSPFRNYLTDLHQKYQSLNDGAVADYIPELAQAKPEWFGICVVTKEGQVFEVGECDKLFTEKDQKNKGGLKPLHLRSGCVPLIDETPLVFQSLVTIQSISKAFVFGLALEDRGRDYVNSKVSVEPTGEAFNSIVLDEVTNRPYNPMVNAGAIAIEP